MTSQTMAPQTMTSRTEQAALLWFLQAQRDSVLAIVDGLSDAGARQVTTSSGWTPAGMVEHLGHAERFWFQMILTGSAPEPSGDDEGDDEDGPFVTARRMSEAIDFYRTQREATDRALSATTLTTVPIGDVPAGMVDEIRNVRDMILHLIEETARHAGHLDIVRELIDGRTGLGPR